MRTSQIFTISALVITATFFGVLSVFGLPESVMGWVVSDVILGTIIYINYLIIAATNNSNKTSLYGIGKKVIA